MHLSSHVGLWTLKLGSNPFGIQELSLAKAALQKLPGCSVLCFIPGLQWPVARAAGFPLLPWPQLQFRVKGVREASVAVWLRVSVRHLAADLCS